MPYVVSVKTGDKRQAGTDANVFIQFYGMDGKTEEIPLKNRSNSFERGQVSFLLHTNLIKQSNSYKLPN